jgi:hypothetical protein
MNKTIIASIAILVLGIGTGSHFLIHSAEAKGMPQHWLNNDGTLKKQFCWFKRIFRPIESIQ